MKTKILLALIAVIAFAMPANASAHISLQPDEAPAGEFTVLNVRVPNEGYGPATTKVSVRFPPGLFYALYQAVPGWSVKVKTRKPPSGDVREITWTADSDRTGIQAGRFLDFPVGTQLPGEAGDTLTFKAVQIYDNGVRVRWVGGPEAPRPAPRVVITDDGVNRGAAASGSPDADDSDSDGNGLAVAALVVGIVALLLGGGALLLGALLGSGRVGPKTGEPGEGMASPHPPSQLRLEDALEEVDGKQDEDDDDQNRDDAHSSPSGRE